MRRLVCSCITWILLCLAGCSIEKPNVNPRAAAPLITVPVDLPRYMGRWYVIANIPYMGEHDYVGSYAEWTLRADGMIDDAFLGRRYGFDQPETGSKFVARVVPGTQNAIWKIRLFWPFDMTLLTLYVDPDYQYTIRGFPDKSLGWILSRRQDISDETYLSLLSRLDTMGYDTSRFKRIPQRPDQLGKPGFQSP